MQNGKNFKKDGDRLQISINRGKDIGITKRMIEAYISMKNFNNLNRFAIWGAINEEQE